MTYATVRPTRNVIVEEGNGFNLSLTILDLTVASLNYQMSTLNGTALSGLDYGPNSASGSASFSYFPAGAIAFHSHSGLLVTTLDGDRIFYVNFLINGIQFADSSYVQTVTVTIKDDDTQQFGTELGDRLQGGRGAELYLWTSRERRHFRLGRQRPAGRGRWRRYSGRRRFGPAQDDWRSW